MQKHIALSMAGKLTVAGLVVATSGILMQYLFGISPDPAMPIILLVAAAVVTFGPWRWAILVGLLSAFFILVVVTIANIVNWGEGARLSDPTNAGVFAGAVIQFLGVIIAFAAAIVATRQTYWTKTTQ